MSTPLPTGVIEAFEGREACRAALASAAMRRRRSIERQVARQHRDVQAFLVPGRCTVDQIEVDFHVDREWGGRLEGELWIPNWRERLVCPLCELNCRQRLVSTLIRDACEAAGPASRLYLMESVTPMFDGLARSLGSRCVGSEYLGHDLEAGEELDGIRHEDAQALSFADASFDVVGSCDVLEHIPDPHRAVEEIARVLKPGGVLWLSIPFDVDRDLSSARATLVDGRVDHLEPARFHGNPLSLQGSLVFTDFGWDFVEGLMDRGFSRWRALHAWSLDLGFLGVGSLVFRAVR